MAITISFAGATFLRSIVGERGSFTLLGFVRREGHRSLVHIDPYQTI